ncbi:hypothetical protein KOR42_30320 [Thalassoglobus neptunius]|uniref:Uncharacterized protein n=2 Tax=Thalassoglobus neptunius TaxID=1938619 RepID=A0A5C5WNE4_9PLAN|nr:hypothetical protein KOR42_30320 [Thalassoglobus neptunius]
MRLTIQQWFRRMLTLTLVLAAICGIVLLAGRLTGLFADWFTPRSVILLPILGGVIAALIPWKPDEKTAASAIDQSQSSNDLFLTLLSIEKSSSDYRPLVIRNAEKMAPNVNPEIVAPFQWERFSMWPIAALVLLMVGSMLVPTLDPFGKVAEAKQEEDQKKLLEESAKQAQKRKDVLAQKNIDAENSEEVEKAVEGLKIGFQRMEKANPKANLDRLNKHQKEIGEIFRKLNSGELKSLFDKWNSEQKFGSLGNQEMFREWQKNLQKGDSEPLQQELDEISDALKELAKTDDPIERTEMERQIQKKLDALEDFSEKQVGSKALTSALQRVKQQLDASKGEPLSQEAMESIQQSMEVAQMEMELVAQSARDLEKLEKALEAIAQAKQMNAEGGLDGEEFESDMTLEDYAELYAQMTGRQGMGEGDGEGEGDGDGDGLGGEGFGEGGEAPEDDSVATGFINETSKSAIQKGKILLSMKTKGLSESGEIKDEEYKQIVGDIQQSLDDVIDQEQIPPGYVDSIKKYFDTLDR